jgi:glycosyltransferase involved in cell wall biosynthesis
MTLLEAEKPGHFALHIVGDGPLRQKLENKSVELGLESIVVFHGFRPDPLPLLAKLRIFLFASAHEGLPMTALEALSLGVPLVSPPIGSLSRLISESGDGRVADSASPRDLADAVLGLGLQPGPEQALRRSLLPERYHIEQGLGATVRLWQEVSGRKQS